MYFNQNEKLKEEFRGRKLFTFDEISIEGKKLKTFFAVKNGEVEKFLFRDGPGDTAFFWKLGGLKEQILLKDLRLKGG